MVIRTFNKFHYKSRMIQYFGVYREMKGATPLGVVLLVLWLQNFLVSCQVDYDYSNGTNGPAHWGNLNPPKWELCKTGKNQSPIAVTMDSLVPQQPKSLAVVYATTRVHAEIYNNGHTPTVEMANPNSGNLTISGVVYFLEDFHFHIPSEHTILNTRFPMEMHLVHKSAKDQIAVIAVLYNLGSASPFLSQFFGNLPSNSTPNVKTKIELKLPMIVQSDPYFRYNGSLTTPPCDERVVWTIINRAVNNSPTLSTQQLQQLQAALPEKNARPIQPKNGRKVYMFP